MDENVSPGDTPPPSPSTEEWAPPPPPPSSSTEEWAPPPPPPSLSTSESTPPPPSFSTEEWTPPPPPLSIDESPPPQGPAHRAGSSVGLTAGVIVGVVVLVAALVIFFVWRRRRTKHQSSASPLEAQRAIGSKIDKEEEGSSTLLKLSPLQTPKSPASLELLQLPESQSHSKIYSTTSTTTSSVSAGDQAHQQLVCVVGINTFTYQELSDATNQFSQDNFLGQGGFGSVFLGDGVLPNGGLVAIKQLQIGSFQGDREFLTEINVISHVHHRNLVSLVGYCISGPQRLLVYEYVENNNLAFHLQGTSTPVLDWPTRLSIALGAAKGISYLHEECNPRIIHRDIKSTNILLDSNFRAKVSDFGLAKFVPDDKTHVSTRIIGTFGYLAPEFGSSGRLTEKSDVFSFGVVLLELITGRTPINLTEWASTLLDQALENGQFETELIDAKLADNYDHEEMNQMVTCAAICVNRFPDHRPRMSQVVQVLDGDISPEKIKAETSRPRMRRPA